MMECLTAVAMTDREVALVRRALELAIDAAADRVQELRALLLRFEPTTAREE